MRRDDVSPFVQRRVLAVCGALVLSLAAALGQVRGAEDAEVEVLATGYAPADEATAKRDAVHQAMRDAVEQAMGTQITVELTVEKKKLANEKILSRSRGFIKSYEIVEQTKEGDLLAVTIKAVVKNGQLKSQLAAIGLIMERKEKPRVMVLTANRQGGSDVRERGPWVYTLFAHDEPTQQVHSAVEKLLLAKEFNLVDAKADARRKALELAISKNDMGKVAALAADAGAEVVINVVATRNFKEVKRLYGTNYRFYDSEVQIRAIRAGTGHVLFSGAKSGTPSATVDPMVDAAKAVSAQCVEAILGRWARDVQNANLFVIRARKVNFVKLVKLQKALSGITGVDAVRRRAFGGGEATIEVDWSGKMDDLGVAISGIEDPKVEITSATQQTLEVEVK